MQGEQIRLTSTCHRLAKRLLDDQDPKELVKAIIWHLSAIERKVLELERTMATKKDR